ncbi:hypothetical protein BAE44_0007990 [Dichanthelium oligosanthes]|uniref:RNase H type-1 domain-containing protein n=1 Tax=Dichanthelium oligosanthes TaxID=888268 RepID=A0A1E5W159_9POAL|nr:hypothetical protein BAE44_0007990 [Dichanthelium oligosanthes]
MFGVSDSETMEALVCREGLALASDLLLCKARVASDCVNIVRSIQGKAMGSHGHIIQEIKARAVDFQKIEFVHEKRESNNDTRKLAKSALHGRHVWLINPPDGICNTNSIIT